MRNIRKPTMEKGGLTYVWFTNEGRTIVEERGGGIFHLEADEFFPGAIIGRPAGREDHPEDEHIQTLPNGSEVTLKTIEENRQGNVVGLYSPAPQDG